MQTTEDELKIICLTIMSMKEADRNITIYI